MQNMQFLCSLWNGQALLGIPDVILLNILTISCNTMGTEREDKGTDCSTNRCCTYDPGS